MGTRVFKSSSSSNGTLYVLLGLGSTFVPISIDKTLTGIAVENTLEDSMENDKALWKAYKKDKLQMNERKIFLNYNRH